MNQEIGKKKVEKKKKTKKQFQIEREGETFYFLVEIRELYIDLGSKNIKKEKEKEKQLQTQRERDLDFLAEISLTSLLHVSMDLLFPLFGR